VKSKTFCKVGDLARDKKAFRKTPKRETFCKVGDPARDQKAFRKTEERNILQRTCTTMMMSILFL
jgi:hypothetical protein